MLCSLGSSALAEAAGGLTGTQAGARCSGMRRMRADG
jgi:hypothetical protein